MANNYLSFSEMISNLTEEEKDWWKEELEAPDFISSEVDEDGEPIEDEEAEAQWCRDRGIEYVDEWPGVQWTLEGKGIWFYTEEYGNVDILANLIQSFFEKFRPSATMGITWSETCSKPRLSEFGGGAVFITAKGQKWMNTHNFIYECEKELKEQANA